MTDLDKNKKSTRHLFLIPLAAILFFLLANILFAWINPSLGYISLYDNLFAGRERFPFGENANEAYNLSIDNVNAMFESHEIESINPGEEYSVFIIGDSSVWGTLLEPQETLAGLLDSYGLKESNNGLPVRVYNLGYPTISLMKDLMILEESLGYQPDLIIWMVTLEAMPWDKQLSSPIVANNPDRVIRLITQMNLDEEISAEDVDSPSFYERTIIGRRREIADIVRLQMYGFLWAATGIDQYYHEQYTPAQIDLEADEGYYGFSPENFSSDDLAFAILEAGKSLCDVQSTRLVFVNEPILVSSGANSDIRYNFYYPRWVYDQYRVYLRDYAEKQDWQLLDLWNLAPVNEFTNSAIHLSPEGEAMLAEEIHLYMENIGILSEVQ